MTNEFELHLSRVDKLSDRRYVVTGIFLTVNTAILGVVGLLVADGTKTGIEERLAAILLICVGIGTCDLWRRMIARLSRVTAWWYERLRELETSVTGSNGILNREYVELYSPSSPRPRGLTQYEIALTYFVLIMYLVLGGSTIWFVI